MTVDVAIVGCGPVGAVLAALLGRAGVRVAVIERDAEPSDLPRATFFDHEAMRIFQTAGYADEVREIVTSNRHGRFTNAAGEVLLAIEHDVDRPSRWGTPDGFNFYQPDLERILRDGARRCPTVELRAGVAVERVRDRGGHAELWLSDGTSLRASWVVGCDGASSTVRRQAGITLEDLGFDQSWIVIDAFANRDLDLPRASMIQRCDPARPSTYIPSVDRHRRWEFMLLDGEDPTARVTPQGLDELLRLWGIRPGDVDVVRAAVHTLHALVARSWRRGRALLAGDAAHQMPPFAGMGMCSGLRDAANLAWKLERVIAGTSDEDLLDTYELERAPQARSVVDLSIALGRIVCTTDPAEAAERDTRLRAGDGPSPRPLPGVGVEGIRHDGPRAGDLFIQPLVGRSDGSPALLDVAVGQGFRLLGRGHDPLGTLDPGLAPWWQATGVAGIVAETDAPGRVEQRTPVAIDTHGFLCEWFHDAGADTVLVRPDHYVFGVAAGPTAATELVADLCQQLAGEPVAVAGA